MAKAIRFKTSSNDPVYVCPYYPVGSIYLSVNSTNPGTIFGGTWEQIKDRFLLACGNSYSNGSTGGSASLQSHTHSIPALSGSTSGGGGHTHTIGADYDVDYQLNQGCYSLHNNSPSGAGKHFYTGSSGDHSHSISTNASTSGSSGSGNAGNMPPYLAVYMWKRIS